MRTSVFAAEMSSLIDDNLLLVSLRGSRLNVHFSVSLLGKVFYVKNNVMLGGK